MTLFVPEAVLLDVDVLEPPPTVPPSPPVEVADGADDDAADAPPADTGAEVATASAEPPEELLPADWLVPLYWAASVTASLLPVLALELWLVPM